MVEEPLSLVHMAMCVFVRPSKFYLIDFQVVGPGGQDLLKDNDGTILVYRMS